MQTQYQWDATDYEKHSKEAFIQEIVDNYIKIVPLDDQKRVHIDMVRIEIEAYKGV